MPVSAAGADLRTKKEEWILMKEILRERLCLALHECFRAGALHSGHIPDVVLEVPGQAEHGDFASNIAMVMAREEKKPPRRIAETIVAALQGDTTLFARVEVAGPGFINFFLNPASWYTLLDEVQRSGDRFGHSAFGQGKKVQVEFVSANPTGPLHIGHGRGAAVGDAVATILQAAGFVVQREYYINDAGNQVALLGRSIWLRWRQLRGETITFPEDGYQGDYIRQIAENLPAQQSQQLDGLPEEAAIAFCSDYGIKAVLAWIERDLAEFGVTFDNWYSERTLYERRLVEKELTELSRLNLTFEKDGALWLRTTDFGDDKDRVLLRSDGIPTYFASDVAYHMEKFERGFDRVVDVWGADHHGYVPRMKAMLAGLGRPPEDLQVLMIQMVNLLREGQPVAMGKRSGEFITLQEVIQEVGRDACRFFFLMRRSDSQLDFDLELAKRQSTDNPVYYVQYAHARVCSINRTAALQNIALPATGEVDFSLLALPEELALTKCLARFPETVEGAARHLEPHRITFYLQELATLFHSYYNRQRVLTDEVAVSRARLYLVNSVRTVLHNALSLLGISAPEQM
jgi:arginyl-tRNA synthetase